MREEIAQKIEAATGEVVRRKERLLPVPTPVSKRLGKKGAIVEMRQHPKWKEIHADILMEQIGARQICEKYDLKTKGGHYPIFAILQHRKYIRAKFPTLFGQTFEQLHNESLVNQVTQAVQHVQGMAQTTFELASKQQREVKVGRKTKLIDAPDFEAMRESAKSYMEATTKLQELAMPPEGEQQRGPQINTQITLMALPKQEGVPQRAMQVIEAQKSA